MGWDNPPIPWDELRRKMEWAPASKPEGAAPPGPASEEPGAPALGGSSGARGKGAASMRPPASEPISRAAGSRASKTTWAELHVHSSYSFLDGASSPAELVAEAGRLGIGTLAITDHDGMYGVPQFAQAAEKAGIRTVFGAELSLERS